VSHDVRQPWTDAAGKRIGAQRPRIFVPAPGERSAGEDVIALGKAFDLAPADWQAWFLTEAQRELDDGTWSAQTVGLVVPRQNGKTLLVTLRLLAGIMLWDEKLIVYSAHLFDTAVETYKALCAMLARGNPKRTDPSEPNYSPQIAAWLKTVGGYKELNHHGNESILFGNGSRIKFVARSMGKGRGFSGDTVVFDEAGYKIEQSILGALLPALSARKNPQVWYLSSSGNYGSDVLLNIRRGALSGAQDVCYAEWSVPQRFDDPKAPRIDKHDVDYWYYANPSLGIWLGERFIRNTELTSLDDEQFLRERLGVWDEAPDVDRPIDLAMWQHADKGGSLRISRVSCLAIDVSRNRKTACLVEVGPAGGMALAGHVVEHSTNSRAFVSLAARYARKHNVPVVVPAYGPAQPYIARLRAAGAEVEELPGGKAPAACAVLADLVMDGDLHHAGQEVLDEAVHNSLKRWVGDAWVFDRRTDETDVTALWALAAGVWYLDKIDSDDDTKIITEDNVGISA